MKQNQEMMKIGDISLVRCDEHNWGVGTFIEREKDGETVISFKSACFHSKLEDAMRRFASKVVDEEDIETLQGYIDRLEAVWVDIKSKMALMVEE